MAEYIEREAICYQLAKQATIDGQPRAIKRAAKIVADFPAADVRPVVRASWEEKEKDGVWWYACSVCGEHIPKGRWGQEWHSRFCPNCGADMREES